MEPYILYGLILPERAQLSFNRDSGVLHLLSGRESRISVKVLLNQLIVYVFSEAEWDIWDLRNMVLTHVRSQVGILGFVRGHAYEVELTRIVHVTRNVDVVLGIDVSCISETRTKIDLSSEYQRIYSLTVGPEGMLLNRCFMDLIAALKNADDSGFYCYRALESLRHHCAVKMGLREANKAVQWERFRTVSSSSVDDLMRIKAAADGLRHGDVTITDGQQRASILIITWAIVDRYLLTPNQSTDPTP